MILSGSIVFQMGGLLHCNRPACLRESRIRRSGPLGDGEARKGRKAGLGGRMGMGERSNRKRSTGSLTFFPGSWSNGRDGGGGGGI